MKRYAGFVLITLVLMSAGCIEEGDEKPGKVNETNYFPLSVGNSWSYDTNIESGGISTQTIMDVQISKKEKISGIEAYVMEYAVGGDTSQIEY